MPGEVPKYQARSSPTFSLSLPHLKHRTQIMLENKSVNRNLPGCCQDPAHQFRRSELQIPHKAALDRLKPPVVNYRHYQLTAARSQIIPDSQPI